MSTNRARFCPATLGVLALCVGLFSSACAEKHSEDKVLGAWNAKLSEHVGAVLTFEAGGKLKASFTLGKDAPQLLEGTYKISPTDAQAFNVEGTFAGQTKTLQVTVLDGGEKLSVGGLVAGSLPLELSRVQP